MVTTAVLLAPIAVFVKEREVEVKSGTEYSVCGENSREAGGRANARFHPRGRPAGPWKLRGPDGLLTASEQKTTLRGCMRSIKVKQRPVFAGTKARLNRSVVGLVSLRPTSEFQAWIMSLRQRSYSSHTPSKLDFVHLEWRAMKQGKHSGVSSRERKDVPCLPCLPT